MKAWEEQDFYLSDITNAARHYHLLSKGVIIQAALIIFSVWILVDRTENSI